MTGALFASESRKMIKSLIKFIIGICNKPVKESYQSIIASDTKISGEIYSSGSIVIFGEVDGKINCDRIFLIDGAVVNPNAIKGEVCYCDKTLKIHSVHYRNR